EETQENAPLGLGQKDQAEAFLDFNGNFAVNCADEQGKLNLNYFRSVGGSAVSTSLETNLYESQKILLASFFSEKKFEPFFPEGRRQIQDLVKNIADWVDRNDRVNEGPGMEGGVEQSVYVGPEYTYSVKNANMASLSELLLVKGMGDDIFQLAAPSLTVYGNDKINLCLADEALVKAVILQMGSQLQPPLRPDDEEKLNEVLKVVQETCQSGSADPATLIRTMAAALGATTGQDNSRALSTMQRMLTSGTRFYNLELTGSSGQIEIKIRAVLDTQGNPDQWKMLYVRVE
ncbi:MAG: type II secretion system protein GspK, partial [bacterium]|nr:type II secretion system protein GspK [bacterium]